MTGFRSPADMLRSARIAQTISAWFKEPDVTRDLNQGRLDLVRIGDITIGRVTCFPGWRWSTHLGKKVGQGWSELEQAGWVIEGAAAVRFPNDRVCIMRAGDLFHIPPEPHDFWVLEQEPFVALYFIGGDRCGLV